MQGWHGMSNRPLGVTIIGLFNLFVSAAVLLGYLILGWKVPPISLAAAIILFARFIRDASGIHMGMVSYDHNLCRKHHIRIQ